MMPLPWEIMIDAGLENFATQLQHGNFPLLICNYDFTATPMDTTNTSRIRYSERRIEDRDHGWGLKWAGLVPENLYGNTKYLDPIQKLNETAAMLKNEDACDMIICLSHLGTNTRTIK